MCDLLAQMRGGNDACDACVEGELQDDAPDCGRGVLHRMHEAGGRFVQEKSEEQEREVDDVEINRVQRLAGLHEVAHEISAAEENNEPVQNRRMLEPLT